MAVQTSRYRRRSRDGDTAHAIGRRVLAVVREHTGDRSTQANAAISADLVLVTVGDCLTTLPTRDQLSDGIRAEATAIVEGLTHRPVTAYLTARHDEPDLALLIFYLAPAPLRIA